MKNCVICGDAFSPTTNKIVCSEPCSKERRRRGHHLRLKSKSCKECNKEFLGKKTEIRCELCKTLPITRNLQKVLQVTTCIICNCAIEEILKNKTKNNLNLKKTCKPCRASVRREYMLLNNPMFDPETARRVSEKTAATNRERWATMSITERQIATAHLKYVMSDEDKKRASDRMKINNPMFDSEIVERAKSSKLSSGYVFPTGKDHWLWKGNRDRSQTIRTRLYPVWVKPLLEKANYTCSGCNQKGGRLEVHHHSHTFNDILINILDGKALSDLNDDEFEKIVLEVLAFHDKVEGMVVCVPCHRIIDDRRH